MPNGQRRNRNSRHANTQRNLQNASVVEASAIAEIAEVVIAAEEYVDNSDEIERLKSNLDSMKKLYNVAQKEICKLKKDEKHALRSIDSFTNCLKVLRDKEGVISMSQNSDGSIQRIVPKYIERCGKEVSFKDIPDLLDEQDNIIRKRGDLLKLQSEEIEKLKIFCKSLITKDKEGIKKMIKSLQVENKEHCREDDDLVCNINFSDEESEEDEEESEEEMYLPITHEGKKYAYGKNSKKLYEGNRATRGLVEVKDKDLVNILKHDNFIH